MTELADHFVNQSRTCGEMGSPIYADLLDRSSQHLEPDSPLGRLFEGWQGHPILDNLPLRWMGALHFLALSGKAPALAACFPSTDGSFELEAAWDAAIALASEHPETIRPLLDECIQTNEVRRCCALYPGALEFSNAIEMPLRLLEIGSSAGLNLGMDLYGYRLGPHARGAKASGLQLDAEWRGAEPPAGDLRISERAGCDLNPIDLSNARDRLRLRSFLWPDQQERAERLTAAIAAVQSSTPKLRAMRAGAWLDQELAQAEASGATLLFHSVMWWYVPKDERDQITATIEAAGASASHSNPLGWLRMEGTGTEYCELRLRTWPGNTERLLARTHYHGAWVEWLEGETT